ncbi:MAG: hypothetical protein V3S51_02810 [Dehalococcoidia bacterium]
MGQPREYSTSRKNAILEQQILRLTEAINHTRLLPKRTIEFRFSWVVLACWQWTTVEMGMLSFRLSLCCGADREMLSKTRPSTFAVGHSLKYDSRSHNYEERLVAVHG